MSNPTKNLTSAFSARIRHDQELRIEAMIERIGESGVKELLESDQERFVYPEIFKKTGRKRNPKLALIRLALDDYLNKLERQAEARENPGLFDDLEES